MLCYCLMSLADFPRPARLPNLAQILTAGAESMAAAGQFPAFVQQRVSKAILVAMRVRWCSTLAASKAVGRYPVQAGCQIH